MEAVPEETYKFPEVYKFPCTARVLQVSKQIMNCIRYLLKKVNNKIIKKIYKKKKKKKKKNARIVIRIHTWEGLRGHLLQTTAHCLS